jgi:two-component system NtrC family response regulator
MNIHDEDFIGRVLVVDDEAGLRLMVRAVLEDAGWEVLEAGGAEEALEFLRSAGADSHPDVIMLDMRMQGMDGLTALGPITEAAPGVPVIMLTAYGTVGSAVEAMKEGAFDYLTKPADNEELKAVLAKALDYGMLLRENKKLKARVEAGDGPVLIGQSAAMQEVRERIEQAGPSEAVVLILGESGTGKELVADALHHASPRKNGPIIKVNCAALPGELLESELFGYVKGAFTGAVKDKPGRFQLAHGGTLFLDEIGDMPLPLQAKLLRVLQERIVEPLGGVRSVPVDVRVLAATHKDLVQAVQDGSFRQDLYYRLNVLEIRIPALRERLDDLPLLTAFLLRRLSEKNKKPIRDVSPGFLQALSGYGWPGNVRELENVLERALVLSRSDSLRVSDLPEQVTAAAPVPGDMPIAPGAEALPGGNGAFAAAASPSSLDEAEKQAILSALELHQGHREKTADALGISRRTLQYKLKKYGLTRRG